MMTHLQQELKTLIAFHSEEPKTTRNLASFSVVKEILCSAWNDSFQQSAGSHGWSPCQSSA
jgi:hypothetical protein